MKLFKISANQKMLKIGDGDKSMDLAPWIMMTDPIIEQMKSHKDWEGKEVTFEIGRAHV